jgi:hypothetical protein
MVSRGRPRAKIDWERVDELARAHCSVTAIAKILKYSAPTLSLAIEREKKMYATDYLFLLKEEGTALMREAIYQAGIKGNIIAQIFWLKNRDGWSDKSTISHEGILPPVQITLAPDINLKDAKMIENFLNGIMDGNERIQAEPRCLSEGDKADNQSGGASIEQDV